MVSDVFKGLGIGFIIAGLQSYFGYIPIVGGWILGNAMWVFLVLGVIFLFMGFRN